MKNSQVNVSRRHLIKLGAGAVGTGLVTVGLASQNSKAEAETTPAKLKPTEVPKTDVETPVNAAEKQAANPDDALKILMEGNDRFVGNKRKFPNQNITRLSQVAKKQTPFAAILGCADSRVPSEIVFDQGFGDLFVCRVAGNVASDEDVGSLEFGTLVLGAKVILVLGHERCGAVDACIKGALVPGRIGSIIEAIRPAVIETKNSSGDKLEAATKSNVKYQVQHLKESSVLSQLIADNKLKIVGGYYDLDTGKVTLIPETV